MDWKELLLKFEESKDWTSAIDLMQCVVSKENASLDAYLSINYLLMNLVLEEDYDPSKLDYYLGLLKRYFNESYSKFSNNPEYLFFISNAVIMAEWLVGLEVEEVNDMMRRPVKLDPENILYKWGYLWSFDIGKVPNREENLGACAEQALSDQNVLEKLNSKGALGEYVLGSLKYCMEKYKR